MKLIIAIAIAISFTLFSIHAKDKSLITDNLATNETTSPYLLTLMIQHLQASQISAKDARQLQEKIISINHSLQFVSKVNLTFFITSEMHKFILNYKFLNSIKTEVIIPSHIIAMQNKFKKNTLLYSSFAKFIIDSVQKDFLIFLPYDFLKNYQNISSAASRNHKKVAQLRKVVKFSGPWVKKITTLPVKDFNLLCTTIILDFFNHLEQQVKIFPHQIRSYNQKEHPPIFIGIKSVQSVDKDPADNSKANSPPTDMAKKNAKKDLKELKKMDPIAPTKDIDKLLQQID